MRKNVYTSWVEYPNNITQKLVECSHIEKKKIRYLRNPVLGKKWKQLLCKTSLQPNIFLTTSNDIECEDKSELEMEKAEISSKTCYGQFTMKMTDPNDVMIPKDIFKLIRETAHD